MVEYPLYWESRKLKYLFTYSLSSVDRHQYDDEKSVNVCHYPDVYHNEKIGSVKNLPTGTCSEEEFQKFKVYPGDILITKDSESRDIGVACLISDSLIDTVCGYHLGIIRPGDGLDSGYFFRFLQTQIVKGYFYGECSGITRFSLGKSSVENLALPVPPPEEQKLISLYLDKKIGQIDFLVEKIQRKINLLKEQRESLINRCITKGLDPNVEMKDSGIEWIGEIPKHWKLGKLKYLINLITAGATPSNIGEDFDENGEVRFLKGEDLIDGQVTPQGNSFISVDVHKKMKRSQLMKGDLLVVIAGTLGKCAIVPEEVLPANTNQAISLIRLKEGVDPVFVQYWFETSSCKNQISEFAMVVAQPNLSMGDLGNITIPIISYDSQKEITLTLSKTTSKMNELLQKEATRIELLIEYRQSLIQSVVTGKVRIAEDMI